MAKKLKCGVIGLGRHMMRSLLPNLLAHENWIVAAAADRDAVARETFATRFPGKSSPSS